MHLARRAATNARRRLAVGAVVVLLGAACGDGEGDDGDGAAAGDASTTTTSAPASTTTGSPGPTGPPGARLSETATCAEFVDAAKPARENATRAALIVFRNGAGVEREPSPEVREEFEVAVVEVCRGRPSAGMLDAMSAVAEVGQGTYLR